MSVTGVSGSSFYLPSSTPTGQIRSQQIQQQFKQLGQDLQSGNLKQAQSDFTALQQNLPSQAQNTLNTAQSSNPLTQEIAKLGTDLQSGNLTGAQGDFATLQQDVQQQQGAGQVPHHHHHHGGGGSQTSQPDSQSSVASLFSELGQALQSGNLSTAQQTYASLQQDFQQSASSGAATSNTSPAAGGVQTVA